jgi:SAM-dependent MidA family methyltransferase
MPSTSLGMPPMPPPTSAPTWKSAWDQALYGPDGFFRRESPAAHFRTSVHASSLLAEALVRLARDADLDTVVDIGAGRGELLTQVRALDPSLTLLGVEVAPRPEGLAPGIDWTSALPAEVDGLVVANEWLDNVPCHLVEVDPAGTPRVLHVDPATGAESHGATLTDSSVPQSLGAWCERWWPQVTAGQPGLRAEVGTTRDAFGALRSYRDGAEVDVLPDGSRDVTAAVAVDAVAARCSGTVVRQRDALRALGVSGRRPELDQAHSDPAGYVEALARAGEAGELTAPGGLGDFSWVVSSRSCKEPHILTG